MIFGEKIIQTQQSALGLIIGHVALIKTQKEDYALIIFLFLSSLKKLILGQTLIMNLEQWKSHLTIVQLFLI